MLFFLEDCLIVFTFISNSITLLHVTHIYREFRKTNYSIEGIFQTVKKDLEGIVDIKDYYADGSKSRFKNISLMKQNAGNINHITGDVNFLALGLKGKKNILTIHDFGYYENPVHNKIKNLIYHYMWYALPLKNINIATVVSEFTKEKLIKYFNFPESNIRVIPDPVKPVFRKADFEPRNSKPKILQIGSGDHKNVMNLLEAVKDMDVQLEIIGWPSESERAKLSEYNIDHTISNKLTDEEVYRKYCEVDILFFASLYEGFGMPIIEAQEVGRPVITSNIGAMKEVGQGSALLVDPNSVKDIRAAIEGLITNEDLKFDTINKGFLNASKYAHKNVAMQYFEVYKELDKLK